MLNVLSFINLLLTKLTKEYWSSLFSTFSYITFFQDYRSLRKSKGKEISSYRHRWPILLYLLLTAYCTVFRRNLLETGCLPGFLNHGIILLLKYFGYNSPSFEQQASPSRSSLDPDRGMQLVTLPKNQL